MKELQGLDRDRSLVDLFNDLDSVVINRAWFKDLWTTREWEAISRFDQWRAAIGKYYQLPPWRQFWTSSAGRKVTHDAAALAQLLNS